MTKITTTRQYKTITKRQNSHKQCSLFSRSLHALQENSAPCHTSQKSAIYRYYVKSFIHSPLQSVGGQRERKESAFSVAALQAWNRRPTRARDGRKEQGGVEWLGGWAPTGGEVWEKKFFLRF